MLTIRESTFTLRIFALNGLESHGGITKLEGKNIETANCTVNNEWRGYNWPEDVVHP